jgi:D-threo-aldose 1-dehydrogenase
MAADPTTPLILGGAPLGGLFAPVADDDATKTLTAAWDHGIRSFDTAPHYGLGLSETRMGAFLAEVPRNEFEISTKVGRLCVSDPDFVDGREGYFGTPALRRVRDYSATGVRRSLDESLVRLGLDRVDRVLIHDPDDHWREAVDHAYRALEQLRAEGVVRSIGVGMNQVEMLERFVAETDIDCVMVAGRYSLLDRSATALLDGCLARGVDVVVAGVFNSGLLADPVRTPTFDYQPADEDLRRRALQLAERCGSFGVSLQAAALQFPTRHPAVRGVAVGARSEREVAENAQSWRTQIPDDLWAHLEQ